MPRGVKDFEFGRVTIGWAQVVSVPLEACPEGVATVQELQRVTCSERSFALVRADSVLVHFERLDDASSFMDGFEFLTESMADDAVAADEFDQGMERVVT